MKMGALRLKFLQKIISVIITATISIVGAVFPQKRLDF